MYIPKKFQTKLSVGSLPNTETFKCYAKYFDNTRMGIVICFGMNCNISNEKRQSNNVTWYQIISVVIRKCRQISSNHVNFVSIRDIVVGNVISQQYLFNQSIRTCLTH